MHTHFSYWPSESSPKERRLCFKAPGTPEGMPQFKDEQTEKKEQAIKKTSLDVVRASLRATPIVGQAVEEAWKMAESKIKSFRTNEVIERETLQRLTDHAEWVIAFNDNPDILLNPAKEELPAETFGPRELLLSLDPAQRKEIYMEYVNRFIPPQVLENAGVALPPKGTMEEQFAALEPKQDVITGALMATLGIEAGENALNDEKKEEAIDIAKKSLDSYYFANEKIPRGLEDDYAEALKYQMHSGVDVVATDPEKVAKNIGPSRLKGALNLGVVTRTDLETMAGELKEWEHKRNLSYANVRSHLDEMMGESKERHSKEAQGLRNTWDRMGGMEKFVLLGAAVYALWKWKPVRIAAMGLTGIYFAQKFLLKEEDPVGTWSKLLTKPADAIKERTKKKIGAEWTPGSVEEVADRASVVIDFLDDYTVTQIERQSIGFGILYDAPISMLAKNFQMEGDRGEKMQLDVGDRTLQKTMSDAAEARGWDKNAFRDFFGGNGPEGTKNREVATEAMTYVFFLKAADNPANAEKVERVIEIWRKTLPGSTLASLGELGMNTEKVSPEMGDALRGAHNDYVELVADGRAALMGSGESLGSFMQSHLNSPVLQKTLFRNEANRKKVAENDVEKDSAANDVDRKTASSDVEKHSAEGDAKRHAAEGDAEKKVATGDAQKKSAEGDAAKQTADSPAEKKTIDSDVKNRTAGEAAKRNVDSDAKRSADNVTAFQRDWDIADRGSAEGYAVEGRKTENAARSVADDGAAKRNAETSERGTPEAAAKRNAAEGATRSVPEGASARNPEEATSRSTESAEGKTSDAPSAREVPTPDASSVETAEGKRADTAAARQTEAASKKEVESAAPANAAEPTTRQSPEGAAKRDATSAPREAADEAAKRGGPTAPER